MLVVVVVFFSFFVFHISSVFCFNHNLQYFIGIVWITLETKNKRLVRYFRRIMKVCWKILINLWVSFIKTKKKTLLLFFLCRFLNDFVFSEFFISKLFNDSMIYYFVDSFYFSINLFWKLLFFFLHLSKKFFFIFFSVFITSIQWKQIKTFILLLISYCFVCIDHKNTFFFFFFYSFELFFNFFCFLQRSPLNKMLEWFLHGAFFLSK